MWVVIACCICSKHDPCIYAARNAQPQRGKIFATQKSFDGASEASGVFYQQRNKFRRSERSERSLISNKKPVATERAKRAEFFIYNKLSECGIPVGPQSSILEELMRFSIACYAFQAYSMPLLEISTQPSKSYATLSTSLPPHQVVVLFHVLRCSCIHQYGDVMQT